MDVSQPTSAEEKQIQFCGEGRRSDELFFVLFYSCLGFLTTFVGLIGRNAFQVPFIVLFIFICLRFAMRQDCRAGIVAALRSQRGLFVIVLASIVSIYALFGILQDGTRTRLLGKPAIILVALMLFAYVWAFRAAFDRERIVRGLFYGIVGGLIGVIGLSAWNGLAFSPFAQSFGLQLQPTPISIYALNDELKILSILMFFAAAGLKSYHRFVPLALALTIFFVSFWTHAAVINTSGNLRLTHTASDVVQFGLPLVMAVFLIAHYRPRLTINIVFSGIAVLLVAAPWIFQIWYDVVQGLDLPRAMKFLVRAEIWDKVAELSLDKPLFGHGLDAIRYMDKIGFAQKYYIGEQLSHPHNMFLQLWMDMGLVGVLLAGLIGYFAWKAVLALHFTAQPAIIAGISMYVLFALATHSLWQTWSMILLCLMCVYTFLYSARPS